MTAPRGALRFSAVAEARSSAEALAASAIDADFYVRTEPRLTSARWRHPAPHAPGAVIDLTAEIPFTVPTVRGWVGPLVGVARLQEYDPPRRVAYVLSNDRSHGYFESTFAPVGNGTRVSVAGWIAVGLPARALMAPAAPLLRRLAARAMVRGIRRADAALQARGER